MLSKLPALPPVDGTPAILMDRIHAFHVLQYSKPNNSCLFITTDAHTPREVYCSSNPSPDRLLCIQDWDQAHLALSWRCNTFGFRFNCTCGKHFSRSHIQDCDLLGDFPVDISQHWAVFSQDLVTHPSLVGTNYSIMNSLLNHTKHDLFDQTLMYLLTKLVTRTQKGLVPRREGSSPDVSSDSDPDNPPEAAPVIPAKQTDECTPTPRAKLCRVMLDAQIADEPAQPAPNTPPPLIESTTATVATTPVIPHNPEPVLPAT
ncbi:hypothetical protein DSO57_1012386 [Entomophthora muscae]|uniref:Uncharacterized protein n=1 Tax=Entomophthora muscae TaxID=34485 RepID=A0ACC2UFJ5_9FUNG|nr:hypothetical protein DSO57_1012386 [Entomophthora muscae]